MRTPTGEDVRRCWERLCTLADRRGAALLALAALAVHAIESTGWPVRAGRDFSSYVGVYEQLWDWHAVLPWATLQRPPLAPLLVGGILDLAGGWGAEIALAVMFAVSVVAWAAAARVAGRGAAVATGIGVLAFPGLGELYHEWAGDVVFATAFALWAVVLTRAVATPSAARFAAVGLGVAVLALVRPSSQSLVLLALFPLVVPVSWGRRLAYGGAVAAAAILPLVCWATLNAARYDDFTVARGGNSSLPLFRAFVADRIVRPDNGPASRRLARLVSRELLPLEPYASRRIGLEEFFSSASPRMHEDLVSLSDRVLGWNTDYALLGQVGREAVRAHPGAFARGVADDLLNALTQPLYGSSTTAAPPARSTRPAGARPGTTAPGAGGQPIPAANQGAYLGTPENRIREVWVSPNRSKLVFSRQGDQARVAAVAATVGELRTLLPTHGRSPTAARWLDRASHVFPPALVFAVVGMVALAWRRPDAWRAALAPTIAALLVITVTVLSQPYVAQYGVPVAPAFVLCAAAGLVGDRRERRDSGGARATAWTRPLGPT